MACALCRPRLGSRPHSLCCVCQHCRRVAMFASLAFRHEPECTLPGDRRGPVYCRWPPASLRPRAPALCGHPACLSPFQEEAAEGPVGSAGLWSLRPLGGRAGEPGSPELLLRGAPAVSRHQGPAGRGRRMAHGRRHREPGVASVGGPGCLLLSTLSPVRPVLPLGSVPPSFFCFGAAGLGQSLPSGKRENSN